MPEATAGRVVFTTGTVELHKAQRPLLAALCLQQVQ